MTRLRNSSFFLLLSLSPFTIDAIREAEKVFHGQGATIKVGSASNATSTRVRIRAYWIRHGISCANIIRKFSLSGIVSQHSYADPNLCDCALEHAGKLGQKIRARITEEAGYSVKPLVFSSALVRSMETALYNFPGENVYPIPYIAEADSGKDNTPLPWHIREKNNKEQDQLESKLNSRNEKATVDRLTFVAGINDKDDPDRADEHKDDYAMFKREFPKILAALLPEDQIVEDATIPVVIVSHSGFMRNNLKCDGTNKPRNNEVWTKDYVVDLVPAGDGARPRKERDAPPLQDFLDQCENSILPQSTFPEYEGESTGLMGLMGKKYPCAHDVARCSRTNVFMPSEVPDKSCCPEIDIG